MGIEEGSTFAVVLEANDYEISPNAETEIGQCILTELRKVRPSVRFLLPSEFRSITMSQKIGSCSDMADWFSVANTSKKPSETDSNSSDSGKQNEGKTATATALFNPHVEPLGLRYIICASRQKWGGGKADIGGGGGGGLVGFAGGYSPTKSILFLVWIFDVKNGRQSGYCSVSVSDTGFYGLAGGGFGGSGGGVGMVLPVIWPSFYRDSEACRALGEEIAKLIYEKKTYDGQGR